MYEKKKLDVWEVLLNARETTTNDEIEIELPTADLNTPTSPNQELIQLQREHELKCLSIMKMIFQ